MKSDIGISKFKEFDNHKLVSHFNQEGILQGFISIHRSSLNRPAFGATRILHYNNESEALKDSLRLSKAMSYKSALAGLKYGGAKGVIIKTSKKIKNRKTLLRNYAQIVNTLRGSFITGTDVGVSDKDVRYMRRMSKFFVGTKTDPARFTAEGVFITIRKIIELKFGNKFHQSSIAIQGVGKTGSKLLELVYPLFGTVYVADINPKVIKKIRLKFPQAIVVDSSEIDKLNVDIFSPCALFHCINSKNINSFQCKVIAGSANNQLESEEVGWELYRKGILYSPDYIINAGGLISVVDEFENKNLRIQRTRQRIKVIENNFDRVIRLSAKNKKPTNEIADKLARQIISNFN